ncbi:hypothetical protein [Vibrio spartinae]|uniref:EamA-like transporter family protein n=1 Tax=Vibrio spartinae TaxID=1918945 RepID=A0A1N6M523_9VIBR|nr:hypothetical protein [Vibrio spartinae]QMV16706.1 EamA-like transporter family protein [Vibrio spartinae]SIO94522.1 EamA-like transporter family protein [Vibrio spartinae]
MNNDSKTTGQYFILGYCILGSAIDVLLSGLLQSVALFVLLFWTFSCTWLGFVLVTLTISPVKFSNLIKSYKLIILLNISTLGSWVGLFIGLKWTEPSIMVAIIFALCPIISVLVELVTGKSIDSKNTVITVMLAIIVTMLVMLAVESTRSNVFHSDLTFTLMLSFVCILTSACLVMGTYIAKKLSKMSFKAESIQSFRFPLLICVCYLLLPTPESLTEVQPSFWAYLPIIVVLGNILPLWMLQKGIERTSVIKTNIIINITPCITFLLELFDSTIEYNNMKLAVLVLLLLVMLINNDDIYIFIRDKIKQVPKRIMN